MGVLSDWAIKRDIGIKPFAEYDKEEQLGKVSYGLGSYGYDVRIGYKFKVFTPVHCAEIDPKRSDPKAFVDIDLTPIPYEPNHVWNDSGRDGWFKCAYCKEIASGARINANLIKKECPEYPAPQQPPGYLKIPPHSFVLGESVEEFVIPRDVLCIVMGKSTYARCGLVVNVTPGEPEWQGRWTIEISNTTPLPARVYAGEGIMQAMFIRTDGRDEATLNAVRRLTDPANAVSHGEAVWLGHLHGLLGKELSEGTCRVSYKDKKGKYQNQEGLTPAKVTGE